MWSTEFHQKPIVAVRCVRWSLAFKVWWHMTFVTDTQEGHRPRTKFPQGVPLDNIGQYQTILCNAWQYQEILNNIGQYHNILKNIITT